VTRLTRLTKLTRMRERPDRSEVLIIGAGPAGLATGACLRRAGIPFLLLEREDRVGAAWHRHYESLHLHTDKAHSSLPYFSYAKDIPRYPSRLQVIEYLEAYARRFELKPVFGENVEWASLEDGHWYTATQNSSYISQYLVVATGYTGQPKIPRWSGQDSYRGEVLHSSRYRNGEPYRGRTVLVVGFGNSGGEIAIDLCEHGARTCLAVRDPVNVIPRDLLGVPVLTISIAMSKLPPRLADALTAPIVRNRYGDITSLGLEKTAFGPFTQVGQKVTVPLVDVGTIDLIRQGRIMVCPGIERFTERGVIFTDGSELDCDAVILATGFRPAVNSFMPNSRALGQDGIPRSTGGKAELPGLFFCGFYLTPTGMFREIAFEAKKIARAIAKKVAD